MTATHVASGTSGSGTVTLPSGGSTGDLIVVDIFAEDSQAVAGTTDITPPAGDDWNKGEESDGTNGASDQAMFWRYQKAGDTPGATTFVFDGGPTLFAAVITVYTDVHATTPIAASGTNSESSEGTTEFGLTGISTTEANQLVRCAVSTRAGSAGWSAVTAGLTERGDIGSDRRIAAYDFTQVTQGATGTITFDSGETVDAQGIIYAIAGVAAPPAAPANPAATANSATQITVTWDDVTDETGYRVERSPNGSDSWADVSGSLAANTVTYTDTGLTCGTTYYYRVVAFNAEGDSDPSLTVNATPSNDVYGDEYVDLYGDCGTPDGANRIGGTGAIRRHPLAVRAGR